VNYLLVKHNDKGAAISILVIYFILFLLMATSFFRLLYITIFDPPYLTLGPAALRDRKSNRKSKDKYAEKGIGGSEYDTGNSSGDTSRGVIGSNNDPDSPGLELFYTRDVFVCERDGKPRWCPHCQNVRPLHVLWHIPGMTTLRSPSFRGNGMLTQYLFPLVEA